MIKNAVLIITTLMILGCVSNDTVSESQEERDEEYTNFINEMCAEVMCQYDVHVKLKQKDGAIYAETFDAMPVVQEDGVMVIAGQTVYFEADLSEGYLTNLKLVDTMTSPDKTVSATLEQMENGGMMLSLSNPFDKHMRIEMGIMPLESDDLYVTSSCPVIAGGGSYEMWPYPIFQVWLGSPRLMDEDESMACRE